jgi:ankyrin repeat protein
MNLDERLWMAISRGDEAEARALIDQGASPKEINFSGMTPLMMAADSGLPDLARFLAPFSNVNEQDINGDTALAWAAGRGHAECARVLLAAGADPAAANEEGATPLMQAARNGKLDTLEVLLPVSDVHKETQFGADALTMAAKRGHLDCVCALVESGAKTIKKEGELTPLMGAVGEGHAETARFLLPLSDPKAKTDLGLTLLMEAALGSSAECLSLALPHSDPLEATTDGRTALMVACMVSNLEAVKILCPVSDLAARDREGKTAWDWVFLKPGKKTADMAAALSEEAARQEALALAAALDGAPGFPEAASQASQENEACQESRAGDAGAMRKEPRAERRPKAL